MINKKWDIVLADEMKKDYFKELGFFIKSEYKNKTIFPPYENIFDALRYTDYDEIKVVILGQDPYHGVGEANGLCFSVNRGIKMPPSLRNIYKELYSDLGIEKNMLDGNLLPWVKEGVMLLNTGLTVEKDKPNSHKNLKWNVFTDKVIEKLNEREEPIVFILWGNNARLKKDLITNPIHLVIESAHPSPFSARNGFFNSKPFSRTNEFLKKNGIKEINW